MRPFHFPSPPLQAFSARFHHDSSHPFCSIRLYKQPFRSIFLTPSADLPRPYTSDTLRIAGDPSTIYERSTRTTPTHLTPTTGPERSRTTHDCSPHRGRGSGRACVWAIFRPPCAAGSRRVDSHQRMVRRNATPASRSEPMPQRSHFTHFGSWCVWLISRTIAMTSSIGRRWRGK